MEIDWAHLHKHSNVFHLLMCIKT